MRALISLPPRMSSLLGVVFMSVIIIAAGCGTQSNPLNAGSSEIGFSPIPVVTDLTGDIELDESITEALNDPDVDVIDLTTNVLTKRHRRSKMVRANKRTVIVVLDRGFQYVMKFPKGALDKDTMVDILVNNDAHAAIGLKFKPHGLKINKPVTIKMRAKLPKDVDIDPEELGLFYNDEENEDESNDNGKWERQRSKVVIKGRWLKAIAEIDHFSQYGLGGYGPIQKWYYQNWYY